jgi:hypothetical protein
MDTRTREQLGAATGLVTVALLGVSFIIGLSPDPPDLNAGVAPVAAFVAANKDALRVEVLLNSVAMLFFLWFIGSIRAGIRGAEGGAGRVSALASGGAIVGVAFVLLSNIFIAAATLHPGIVLPGITHTLVDLSSLSIGIGASAFAVFFIGVAAAVVYDGGLPKWLGWLSLLVGLLAAVGLVSVFSDNGIFAADGAFGYWARYGGFVVWTLCASAYLVANPPKGRGR